MISIYDMVIPDECRVIVDFDKRLVFHRGETFRIESATESFVGFAVYDDVKHIRTFTGDLDRVTGTLTLSGTPETRWSENLKCQARRATDVTVAAERQGERRQLMRSCHVREGRHPAHAVIAPLGRVPAGP
jgi:hypothetical protein